MSSDSLTDPSPTSMETPNFSARDASAVIYSKSLLDEGDTLVFITYPNRMKVYDSTGFEIRQKHRVHSEKLLATGSTKFKKWLEDEWYQHRLQRRHHLIGGMPTGIKYILDLTPPEEGDDAIELTAELSCPTGILLWHTSADRCGISLSLVGGKDETTVRADHSIQQPSSDSDETAPSERAQAVTSIINGTSTSGSDPDNTINHTEATVLDYCPIRHRTGIERLLQVIEGKDPRLDSAPKVWTLAVLAKHFECTSAVIDYIFTWMWADPNVRIIEILPEACLRIGLMLQSMQITRAAFSILVSEEALRLGTEEQFNEYFDEEKKKKEGSYGPGETRFGRLRDNIDEDTLNIIQHAGRQYADRIDGVMGALLHPQAAWIQGLQEFTKLKLMEDHNSKCGVSTFAKRQPAILALLNELIHYIRGRLNWSLMQQMNYYQTNRANEHRRLETYKKGRIEKKVPTEQKFNLLYDTLRDKERVVTIFFWEILRDLGWSMDHWSNQILDDHQRGDYFPLDQKSRAGINGIRKVTMHSLIKYAEAFNQQVADALKNEDFNKGRYPQESDLLTNIAAIIQKLNEMSVNPTNNAGSQNLGADEGYDHPADSPFFSLGRFFTQVNHHIQNVCAEMLDRGENEWCVLTDTVLCLGEEEFKFLPLYAGGLDDGSGGVFEPAIPVAESGPSGPGPAFHTGSTLASSSASWEEVSGAESVEESSLGVEDGHSEDHLDRKVVKAVSDF